MQRKYFALILVTVFVMATVFTAESAAFEVAKGVYYYRDTPPGRSIHILEVDLCAAGLAIRATGKNDGTMTVSQFARRVGALVAINGGHANEGGISGPSGPAAHDGVFFGKPNRGDFGQITFGRNRVAFIPMAEAFSPQPWMKEVVSGLLTLVHEGKPMHAQINHSSYTCQPQHPRTLIGLTADRKTLFMVVVDGRRPQLGMTGMTCAEAIDFMVSLGAHWALNLDGGGSSTMWVNGAVVNSPSDGSERSIGSHLALVPTGGSADSCNQVGADMLPILQFILE